MSNTAITLVLDDSVVGYIDQLIPYGVWGETREEVCIALLHNELIDLYVKRLIVKKD